MTLSVGWNLLFSSSPSKYALKPAFAFGVVVVVVVVVAPPRRTTGNRQPRYMTQPCASAVAVVNNCGAPEPCPRLIASTQGIKTHLKPTSLNPASCLATSQIKQRYIIQPVPAVYWPAISYPARAFGLPTQPLRDRHKRRRSIYHSTHP